MNVIESLIFFVCYYYRALMVIWLNAFRLISSQLLITLSWKGRSHWYTAKLWSIKFEFFMYPFYFYFCGQIIYQQIMMIFFVGSAGETKRPQSKGNIIWCLSVVAYVRWSMSRRDCSDQKNNRKWFIKSWFFRKIWKKIYKTCPKRQYQWWPWG